MEARNSLYHIHSNRYLVIILLALASGFLLAGLFMPILTVTQMGFIKNTFSIPSGIHVLIEEKHYLLAFIVFVFSVIFPVGKIVVLFFVWFWKMTASQRELIINGLKILGKWSMLDVFVVAIIVVAAKLAAFASAEARIGIYVFGLAIILSMITTMVINHFISKSDI